MMLASRMGLSVPEVTIRKGQDRLYIVERFDRERSKDGKILRLHQEDFCQALLSRRGIWRFERGPPAFFIRYSFSDKNLLKAAPN